MRLPKFIYLSVLALSISQSAPSQSAGQQDRPGTRALSIGDKAEVRYTARWTPSAVTYANATELVVMRKVLVRADGADKEREVEYPEARILIATEPRTSHADAVKRLSELAASREASVQFVEIGGWPALEATFVEELERIGKNPSPPAFSQRGLVAIAANSKLVRFEISLVPDADLGLLYAALEIARSASFSGRGDPSSVKATLRKLGAARPARTPKARPGKAPAPPAHGEKGGSGGAASAGAAVRVQNGQGELEVAASADANTVVIASNTAESFSTNRGGAFAAGNPGVFPLNDPSLARAVSSNFYLGVIAFPNGTAAQLNQTGCTNAVSRSTDNGANFGLQGFSALCPFNGAGICFPDQEHIAADAVTATAAGGDQLYAVWRNFVPAAAAANCQSIQAGFPTSSISCSQDNGATWTARAAIAGAGDFPRVAVGRDGSVYVASISGSSVLLNKFTSCANGLAAVAGFPTTPVALTARVGCPVPGLDRCNSGNTLSSPTVAPDPADANHLFVAAAESDTTGGERIVTIESRDAGLTFPRRATVSGTTSARRFMPWGCSTLGNVWVGWYDRRAALAAGANNDLTDYFIGSAVSVGGAAPSLTPGSTRNLTNNPDPQCASGWPCLPRSSADSDSCTVQPQLAGQCQTPAGGGSLIRCDFSAGGCPAGETCQTGLGCPKYGDYNGIACAGNYVLAAWSSATAPAGLPAAAGLTVFSSAQYVGPSGGGGSSPCRLHPDWCVLPTRLDPNTIFVKCNTLPCLLNDHVNRNCMVKWSCPGCGPLELCPPYYHMVFDDTVRPWQLGIVDGEGRDVPHKITRIGKNVVLTLRPSKALFKDGSIGDYILTFKAGKSIKPGIEYRINVRLQASNKSVPDLAKLGPN